MNAPAVSQSAATERAAAESPRRAGFIIPSSNRRFEPEAAAFLPAGVVPHIARARMTGPWRDAPEAVLARILDAARCLADARCELLFMHCTAHSTKQGPQGELDLLTAIREATGIKAVATGLAIRAAFAALGARRVAVATPYDRATTDEEVRYFEACDFTVVYARAYDLTGTDAFCSTPPRFWREAMADDSKHFAGSDAVLLSCANIRCLEALDSIEAAAGRPLITSNQAGLWYAARAVGVAEALPQFGCLSQRPIAAA